MASREMQLLAPALLFSLFLACDAYRSGDFVRVAHMQQYHSMRTSWKDLLGKHCPRFGIDTEVLLPLPKPEGYTGADPCKIMLEFGEEKYKVPWQLVIGRSKIPMIDVTLRFSGGDLLGVFAIVVDMPQHYVEKHEKVMKEFWDVERWPKHVLVRYSWEEVSDIDVETGLYILFGSGFTLTLVIALHVLQSSKEKLARFVRETVVNNTLPGEEAKVE